MKDPRTGTDFNPTFAIRTLYHLRSSRDILVDFIKKRIPEITEEEISAFVPEQDNRSTNTENFINLIRTMANSSKDNNFAYARHNLNLQRFVASNSTSPSTSPITINNLSTINIINIQSSIYII